MDHELLDFWREFSYYKVMSGAALPYDDASAVKTEWFLAFDAMEKEVQAELNRERR